jgi:hypothetical protein
VSSDWWSNAMTITNTTNIQIGGWETLAALKGGEQVAVTPKKPVYGKKPVTAQNPYLAAQELRTTLFNLTKNGTVAGGLTQQQQRDLSTYLRSAQATLASLQLRQPGLFDAARARKAAATVRLLEEQAMFVDQLVQRLANMESYLTTVPVGKAAGSAQLNRLYELSQALPTQDDIPKTAAENTLRAIIALLRNHHWPGVENVTQERKEVGDGTEQEVLAKLAAAVGEPVGIGPDPGSGVDPDADEDE